jgi:hypothetical protein
MQQCEESPHLLQAQYRHAPGTATTCFAFRLRILVRLPEVRRRHEIRSPLSACVASCRHRSMGEGEDESHLRWGHRPGGGCGLPEAEGNDRGTIMIPTDRYRNTGNLFLMDGSTSCFHR